MASGLTALERQAGRRFRAECNSKYLLHPSQRPDAYCTPFIRNYRHECPARGGASTALALHEQYELSPEYDVAPGPDGDVFTKVPEGAERLDWDVRVRAGLFAFIWKQGECPACHLTVRSRTGRVVLAADRPPAEERKVPSGGQA